MLAYFISTQNHLKPIKTPHPNRNLSKTTNKPRQDRPAKSREALEGST